MQEKFSSIKRKSKWCDIKWEKNGSKRHYFFILFKELRTQSRYKAYTFWFYETNTRPIHTVAQNEKSVIINEKKISKIKSFFDVQHLVFHPIIKSSTMQTHENKMEWLFQEEFKKKKNRIPIPIP